MRRMPERMKTILRIRGLLKKTTKRNVPIMMSARQIHRKMKMKGYSHKFSYTRWVLSSMPYTIDGNRNIMVRGSERGLLKYMLIKAIR